MTEKADSVRGCATIQARRGLERSLTGLGGSANVANVANVTDVPDAIGVPYGATARSAPFLSAC